MTVVISGQARRSSNDSATTGGAALMPRLLTFVTCPRGVERGKGRRGGGKKDGNLHGRRQKVSKYKL